MHTLMKITLALLFTLQLNAAYKGGKPSKLADELADRLEGCKEHALYAYYSACADRQKTEELTRAIATQNAEALFGNNPDEAQKYEEITQKINELVAEQLRQTRDAALERCHTRNKIAAQSTQS